MHAIANAQMKANEKATKMRLSKLVKHGIQLAMGPEKQMEVLRAEDPKKGGGAGVGVKLCALKVNS